MNYGLIQYEILVGSSPNNAVIKAEKILSSGWSKRGYQTIFLDSPIPWLLDDNSQRSWNFYLHCWDMLELLLQAYSKTLDSKYLQPSIRVALDWARLNAQKSNDERLSFAWYDMSVGLRAYRLAYIIDASRHAGILNEDDDELLWQIMLEHQDYLADDNNIVFHNNHGYYQVAGQLAMGRRFHHLSTPMNDAYYQGQDRLQMMLNQQFTSDGVHREHSPDYHRMVYDTLSGLILSDLLGKSETLMLTEKIENALAWFIQPNQRLVNFGDSDYRDISRNSDEAERKWKTPAMRWLVSGGVTGDNVGGGLHRFDEGGYFIYRQRQSEFSSQGSYLAQIAAFHSRTHKHADDQSFVWYDRGCDILVDSGRYGYLGNVAKGSQLWHEGHWYSDPKRIYCESTRAHNCLEFDDQNYPRKGIKPYGSALCRSLEHESGLIVMETECRHFKGNRHARVLILSPGEWLIVFDWYHDNLDAKHAVKQWFHMAPHWKLCPNESGFHAISSSTEQRLSIGTFTKDTSASRPYLGELMPTAQGWWSPAERQLVPNYAFNYAVDSKITGSLATIFSFSEKIKIDHSRVKFNKTGRALAFAWLSEFGNYKLNLTRPENGALEIEYKVITPKQGVDILPTP